MIRQLNKDDRGMTLMELMIAMCIGLLLLAALAGAFWSMRGSFRKQDELVDIIQTARAAMDTMAREIRMAGFDPTEAGFGGIVDADGDGTIEAADATQIQIRADLDEDGDADDSNEDITYAYDSGNMRITRNTGGGNQPFAESVASLDITYFDAAGGSASSTSDVRKIKITITVQNPDGTEARTLTSSVKMRNLGLLVASGLGGDDDDDDDDDDAGDDDDDDAGDDDDDDAGDDDDDDTGDDDDDDTGGDDDDDDS